MKSKDVQKVVLSKYEKDDGTTKIFQDLNGTISLSTIERWYRRIRDSDSINLFKPPGRPRIIRTKGTIEKMKVPLNRRNLVSSLKLKNGAPTIFLRSFRGIIDLQTVLIKIHWIIVFGTNSGKTMKWNRVTSKKSLIVALKPTVKEMLILKVARLGPINYIGYHKTKEIN